MKVYNFVIQIKISGLLLIFCKNKSLILCKQLHIMKVQLDSFVDFEKCCKMRIWLRKSVLIQPRTSRWKRVMCRLQGREQAAPRGEERSPRKRGAETGYLNGERLMPQDGSKYGPASNDSFVRLYRHRSARDMEHFAAFLPANFKDPF